VEALPGVSGEGLTRTDMHCHKCGKGFIAELDFAINGNHVVECPRCGHEHCRVIKNGVITGDRWDGRNGETEPIRGRSFWKSSVLPAQTSTAAAFLRHRWLNLTQG
jgi:DNA-directed RNA polymerase subunit RPC12/RpoP